ncbi:MAG: MFS transporter [Methanolinea sp.]|jgi:EmrB/QacA subfamily drug resistance transporter|nr:MFS transporter [Methanolinea sp.]
MISEKDGTGLRVGIIQSVILAAIAMAVIDGIVVSIALPTITRDFVADVAQSQWIITAYLVTETSLLLLFGSVSHYTGKRTLFLAGLVLFTTASLACGLSTTLSELIVFRVLQACGSAMIFSISGAMLFEISSPGSQGRTMGYIGAVTAAAGIAAPILGGLITDSLGWEYIFLINVPIGILGLVLFARHFPSEERREHCICMDWPGSAAMAISLLFLVLFLVELSSALIWSFEAGLYLFISILSLLLFLYAESRSAHPLLDLSVFRNLGFTLPNLAMVCIYMAFFMLNLIGPFYFEGVMDLKPSQVGLVFFIAPLIMVIASPLSGWVYDHYSLRSLPAAGILLTGISLLLLNYAVLRQDLALIVLLFVPLSIGGSLFHSSSSTDIMRALPLEMAGLASSVSATLRNLGMTLGVSVAGILLTMELYGKGYTGPVQDAAPGILAGAISTILLIGAALCGLGGAFYLVKNLLVDRK